MSHQILDDKKDNKCIESFIPATKVDLNNICLGTQIYYLYKEEDDNTILSWYWGCVIEINKTKKNGEHYHIWHDDEDPWIDLSKDKKDWKQIPPTNQFYDTTFDINQYLIITQPKKKKSRTKKKKKTTKKSIPNKEITQKTFNIGNQGFASIIPGNTMSCTITDGPNIYPAVCLQSSSTNPYKFWVRRQDIKQVLTDCKLCGQRVGFELNGITYKYKIIAIDALKTFIQCYWKKNTPNTWIETHNFTPKPTPPPSISSITDSNKENEDEIHLNDGNLSTSSTRKRRHKKRKKSTPSLSVSDCMKNEEKNNINGNGYSSINNGQVTLDLARYQQLQTQARFYNNSLYTGTPQSQFLRGFTSPLAPPRRGSSGSGSSGGGVYRYEAEKYRVGEKRQREDILCGQPANKRQRLNGDGSSDILRLVAIQPPQPQHMKMPELQPSNTPKANKAKRSQSQSQLQLQAMPSPSFSDFQSKKTVTVTSENENFADDVSSIGSGVGSESPKVPVIDGDGDAEMHEGDKNNSNVSDTESQDTILSQMESNNNNNNNHNHNVLSQRRHVLSEPPPHKSSRYNIESGWHGYGYGFGYRYGYFSHNMVPICFPMVSMERITDKIMDKSLSDRERIDSLKSIVKYLSNCQNTMNEMWGQIGSQCQNVIRCVEAIIQDLQERC